MVVETDFLTKDELFHFNRELIDQVAFPVGDRYPIEIMTNYFAWYGGMVKKYRPIRFLEIGVRYGYTGIVCCLAALKVKVKGFTYLGIDDESYLPAPGVMVGSCTKANENFAAVGFDGIARALKWNSITQGLPPGCGTFDMIHIDGNHDTHGVLNDLGHCWPVLNKGGFILLDDYYFPEIKLAVEQWLEPWTEREEVVAVQFVKNERGHCYMRKTGLMKSDDRAYDLSDPLMSSQ